MSEQLMGSARRITRRQFLHGGGGVAAVALVAACTPQAPQPVPKQSGPAKIAFAWPFGPGQALQSELAKRFMEQHKAIEVEVEVIPQMQYVPKMTTAFSAGSAPDALATSPAWLSQFAAAGWLENVEEPLKSSGLDKEVLPVAMAQARLYRNTAFMVGCVVDTHPLYYNKQHFADAGLSAPPATTDEFAAHARKLTDASKNRFGYYQWANGANCFQHWSTWMLAHGGIGANNTLFDADKKCVFAGPKHVEGMDHWLALYRDAKVSPPASVTSTAQDGTNAFNAGQIGMVMGFLGGIGQFSKSIGADKFGVALPPAGPAGQFFHYGVNGYAISAQSKHKAAAWEYVRFLMSPEVNEQLNKEWGAIPAHSKALNAEWLSGPHFQAPKQMVQKVDALVHTPRQLPEWAKFFESHAPEQTQKGLLGQQTAQQFATSVSEFLNSAMKAG